MPPKTNLIKYQLQSASADFRHYLDLAIQYKWWIVAVGVLFLLLIWWLWRR